MHFFTITPDKIRPEINHSESEIPDSLELKK